MDWLVLVLVASGIFGLAERLANGGARRNRRPGLSNSFEAWDAWQERRGARRIEAAVAALEREEGAREEGQLSIARDGSRAGARSDASSSQPPPD